MFLNRVLPQLLTLEYSLGAFCESPGQPWDGQPCSFDHSTCGNKTQDCHGRGPGFQTSDFASNLIIAQKQVDGAKALMEGADKGKMVSVTGPVGFVHVYLDMYVAKASIRIPGEYSCDLQGVPFLHAS